MSHKLDKETDKIYKEGEEIANLVESTGWHKAKAMLFAKLAVLDSVVSLETQGKSLEELGKEAYMRAAAISVITEWIADVEGMGFGHKEQTRKFVQEEKEKGYIERYPNQVRGS